MLKEGISKVDNATDGILWEGTTNGKKAFEELQERKKKSNHLENMPKPDVSAHHWGCRKAATAIAKALYRRLYLSPPRPDCKSLRPTMLLLEHRLVRRQRLRELGLCFTSACVFL